MTANPPDGLLALQIQLFNGLCLSVCYDFSLALFAQLAQPLLHKPRTKEKLFVNGKIVLRITYARDVAVKGNWWQMVDCCCCRGLVRKKLVSEGRNFNNGRMTIEIRSFSQPLTKLSLKCSYHVLVDLSSNHHVTEVVR